jgi:hypothetical protein
VDRGYEGGSGYLGHLGSAAGPPRWDTGQGEPDRWGTAQGEADRWGTAQGEADRWGTAQGEADRWGTGQGEADRWGTGQGEADRWGTSPVDRGNDVAAGVARRLQARLERHVWLLERLQAAQIYPEPPGLPELQETARRMRRDSESLLLLSGHAPGVRSTGPRRLADLVAEAAALAEEPRRVDVRSAPAVVVAPAAAAEFVHVLAELVDHVTAVYPGARIELVSRLDPPADPRAGATVDALVDGAARHDPEGLGGRRAAAAAEQLARCSRHGIVLRRPPGGPPPTGSGLVASVHCPPGAVTVEEQVRLPPPETRANGNGLSSYDLDSGGWLGSGLGGGVNGFGGPHGASPSAEPVNGTARPSFPFDETPSYSTPSSYSSPSSYSPPSSYSTPPPSYSTPPPSQIDELFGPLLDLPLEPIDDRYATPIFEAIASAWFREDASGGEPGRSTPLDWQTPQDDEWREAAARAARSEPAPTTTTSTGLPRRRPGSQLVPPPRSTMQNGQNGQSSGPTAERVPDRVRDRLSTYQRGLREGRHRAVGSESSDPEDW